MMKVNASLAPCISSQRGAASKQVLRRQRLPTCLQIGAGNARLRSCKIGDRPSDCAADITFSQRVMQHAHLSMHMVHQLYIIDPTVLRP
jgi:hypothetical protein